MWLRLYFFDGKIDKTKIPLTLNQYNSMIIDSDFGYDNVIETIHDLRKKRNTKQKGFTIISNLTYLLNNYYFWNYSNKTPNIFMYDYERNTFININSLFNDPLEFDFDLEEMFKKDCFTKAVKQKRTRKI